MSRRVHFLAPNHTTRIPTHAFYFDTETDPVPVAESTVEHRLRFGWAAFSRRHAQSGWNTPEWCRFESLETFYGFLESGFRERTRMYAFCHNTSFDLPVLDLFHALPERGWTLRTAIIDAPPTILRFRKGTRTLIVLDTLNFWPIPLAELGKSIGLDKLPMPDPDASREAWDRYGKRDVEILIEATRRWWRMLVERDLGGFAHTRAGQSFRAYRHRFMEHRILIDAHERALGLARAAYTGGRVECFRLGEITEPCTLLDVHSMYPSVMREGVFPTVLRGVATHVTERRLERWLAEGCVVADVTLQTEQPAFPVVRDGRLLFPVGRFRTSLASPELRLALRMGACEAIHAAAVYQAAPLFRRFVDEFYGLRLEALARGDETEGWLLKRLMNSLYGKFGQRGLVFESEESIPDLRAARWEEIHAQTGQRIVWRQLGGLRQRQREESESRESHPAIAAHVTSAARVKLWSAFARAGPSHSLYCDTDSLVVDRVGLARLRSQIDDSRLGAWGVKDSFSEGWIWGPKDYRFGAVQRTKGVRKRAHWTSPDTVVQERWSSLRGLVSADRLHAPSTTTHTKTLQRVYQKGCVKEDGRVVPFLLAE